MKTHLENADHLEIIDLKKLPGGWMKWNFKNTELRHQEVTQTIFFAKLNQHTSHMNHKYIPTRANSVSELKTLEWWISRLVRDPYVFIISTLI